MSLLNQLGVKFSTDKSTLRHGYLDFYELLFARFTQHLYINLLEIGIQFGNSIRMWREYFPYANITGIDLVDNKAEGPHKTIIGNAYSQDIVGQLVLSTTRYHIIIEDGSHEPNDQVFTVQNYPQLLTESGILVIEDIASMDVIGKLVEALPENYHHAVVDLRTVNPSVVDNILFVTWKS